ncbi:MAG TPA: PLP-dependent aminotransferase family protein [Candidatus Sulfotelmatobacter sp.]|nr:PLP-dependent aminotransferase family protein [Candidatus Sulfotelmatobacter sp.]
MVHFEKIRQTTSARAKRRRLRASGWAELTGWHVDRRDATPLFRQVYGQIRAAILASRLRPGTKLPSTRALATELGVARASVVQAYEQLLAEGYATGRVGAGTFVSSDLPAPPDRAPHAKRAAAPSRPAFVPARSFPHYAAAMVDGDDRPFNTGRLLADGRTIEIWRRLTQRAFRTFGPNHLGYSDARGLAELRQAIADYLPAARAVRCDPEQILVTAGTQHAIDLAIRVLLAPGDPVWVEDPGYPLTHGALRAAGLALHPIPVDAQGIDVAAGIRAAPRARAVFVTPSHQFPLGVVLSMTRRLELLAWARDTGAWIIEDDYQSEFRYGGRPLAALQGLDDAERVIYVGTLNKVLFPGLRLGYMVVPHALLNDFVAARYLADRQPATPSQILVTALMTEGYFAAHIRRMRLLYRDQRDTLVAALERHGGDALTVAAPDQGMHLVARLRRGLSDVVLERRLRERGLIVRALSPMYAEAPARAGFLLGFTGFPRPVIAPAATRLARFVRQARL